MDDHFGPLFEGIFSHCTLQEAKLLSRSARRRDGIMHLQSLTYGEIEHHAFLSILRQVSPTLSGRFYDLGSGTGVALLAARVCG